MPRIPRYQRSELPSGQSVNAPMDVGVATAISRAVGGVGQDISQLAGVLQEHAQRRKAEQNKLKAYKIMNDFDAKMMQHRINLKKSELHEGIDVLPRYQETWQKEYDNTVNNAPPEIQQYIASSLERDRTKGWEGLATHGQNQRDATLKLETDRIKQGFEYDLEENPTADINGYIAKLQEADPTIDEKQTWAELKELQIRKLIYMGELGLAKEHLQDKDTQTYLDDKIKRGLRKKSKILKMLNKSR